MIVFVKFVQIFVSHRQYFLNQLLILSPVHRPSHHQSNLTRHMRRMHEHDDEDDAHVYGDAVKSLIALNRHDVDDADRDDDDDDDDEEEKAASGDEEEDMADVADQVENENVDEKSATAAANAEARGRDCSQSCP
jgi:hypothetical protein